jgi:hypothetical protein
VAAWTTARRTSERCDEAQTRASPTATDDGDDGSARSTRAIRRGRPSRLRAPHNAVCVTDFAIGRVCDLTLGCTGGAQRDDANAWRPTCSHSARAQHGADSRRYVSTGVARTDATTPSLRQPGAPRPTAATTHRD